MSRQIVLMSPHVLLPPSNKVVVEPITQ